MKPLPSFALNLLNSCPQAGGGVHNWLFRSARCLHPFWSAEKIAMELMHRTINCGRFVPEKEVLDAVRNSSQCTWISSFTAFLVFRSASLGFCYSREDPYPPIL